MVILGNRLNQLRCEISYINQGVQILAISKQFDCNLLMGCLIGFATLYKSLNLFSLFTTFKLFQNYICPLKYL